MRVIKLYVGKPSYKRVLFIKRPWLTCHPRNIKFHVSQKFPLRYRPIFNIQLVLIGVCKNNGSIEFRLFNWALVIGW